VQEGDCDTSPSQSLHTDQGISDGHDGLHRQSVQLPSLNPSIHQGNSDEEKAAEPWKALAASQSLHTDQGSFDYFVFDFAKDSEVNPSQSLHTDQGSFDSTPRKPLESKALRWLFFQPLRKLLPLKVDRVCFTVSPPHNFLIARHLEQKSSRCAKTAIRGWHASCPCGQIAVFKERPSTSKSTPGGSLLQRAEQSGTENRPVAALFERDAAEGGSLADVEDLGGAEDDGEGFGDVAFEVQGAEEAAEGDLALLAVAVALLVVQATWGVERRAAAWSRRGRKVQSMAAPGTWNQASSRVRRIMARTSERTSRVVERWPRSWSRRGSQESRSTGTASMA
jgi:hypothetical protein